MVVVGDRPGPVGKEGVNPEGFAALYAGAPPPWDIGRPQPAFVELAEAGAIVGSVLDVGCGTGENALYLAARGHEVVGIDLHAVPIERARAKAIERGIVADLHTGNALDLGSLGRRFDTIIDCGLFHVFSDVDRSRYVASLDAALAPDGRYFMLVFSEKTGGERGPRRVTRREIREAFAAGWEVREIVETRFENNEPDWEVIAWRAWIERRR